MVPKSLEKFRQAGTYGTITTQYLLKALGKFREIIFYLKMKKDVTIIACRVLQG